MEPLELEESRGPGPQQSARLTRSCFWRCNCLAFVLGFSACAALVHWWRVARHGRGRTGVLENEQLFKGAVFFGHMNPDMDSFGSAYGSAELFEGTAACPMSREKCPNAEGLFVMGRFGVTMNELPVLDETWNEKTRFVLVDFNDPGKGPHKSLEKLPKLVGSSGMWLTPPIMGVIDHHALQLKGVKESKAPMEFKGSVGDSGLQVETQPWGSACSIIALKFRDSGRVPSTKAAGMLASGILSDTLGLTGPTTTDNDRRAVEFLKPHAGIPDHLALYEEMAEAKSAAYLKLPLVDVFDSDLKTFNLDRATVNIAAVEVANDNIYKQLLNRPSSELAEGIRLAEKKRCGGEAEGKPCWAFILLVDTKGKKSCMMMLPPSSGESPSAKCLAKHAFSKGQSLHELPESKECREDVGVDIPRPEEGVLDVISTGSCISRKSQVQPPLVTAVEDYYAEKFRCEELA